MATRKNNTVNDGFGLDKDRRLVDQRERKQAEKNSPPPLNPKFPFHAVVFDPILAQVRRR